MCLREQWIHIRQSDFSVIVAAFMSAKLAQQPHKHNCFGELVFFPNFPLRQKSLIVILSMSFVLISARIKKKKKAQIQNVFFCF